MSSAENRLGSLFEDERDMCFVKLPKSVRQLRKLRPGFCNKTILSFDIYTISGIFREGKSPNLSGQLKLMPSRLN